ncbi:MAG: tripartite tricarboxylate transporter substrate binding protein [Betaproteobacteria bacterium]|nr:tripartite tricarboxylate transporter substrate binding protein [Betaproteobacteria bacterium]
MKRTGRGVLLCALIATPVPAALAQPAKYPERPIRLISPFPPGGTVDVNARILAPAVSKSLGQQVVVDNRAGASGIIGTAAAANAAPDGYTLLLNTTPMVTNTLMYAKVPYNVLRDFEPISILSTTPSMLSVHPSVPARSVRELLQLAKARPGTLNYASAGVGTNPHIAGELLNYLGKVNIQAVQFKGGGPALVAAISGEVGVAFSGVAGAVQFVQSGRLRALGVTSLKPVAALPGVPSIAEAGLPGYEFVAWFVLAAPKGTPREIILTLNDHFRKAMSFPETLRRFEVDGLDVVGSTPEQAAATLASELKKWATVIRERGMKAE